MAKKEAEPTIVEEPAEDTVGRYAGDCIGNWSATAKECTGKGSADGPCQLQEDCKEATAKKKHRPVAQSKKDGV